LIETFQFFNINQISSDNLMLIFLPENMETMAKKLQKASFFKNFDIIYTTLHVGS